MFAASGALETRSRFLALSIVPPGPKLGFSNFLHYVILMVSLSGVSLEIECHTYYRGGAVVLRGGYLQLRRDMNLAGLHCRLQLKEAIWLLSND
jgi:hypothetical protein